jgi:uncharacterized protein (DUF1330 family)
VRPLNASVRWHVAASVINSRVYVVATLTVRQGELSRFEEYERQALAIAAEHGGCLERAVRAEGAAGGGHVEVHVLSFPDADALAAFRADTRLEALAIVREAVIAKTEVYIGVKGPAYAT